MRHALLSLVHYDAPLADSDVNGGYIGFAGQFPLAEGDVILSQIDLASKWGAETIMCMVEQVTPEIAILENYIQKLDMRMVLVRKLSDCAARLSSDDELLILADGLYCSPRKAQKLLKEKGGYFISFSPGENEEHLTSHCERIDINHVWAGIAVVKGDMLFDAINLPADWDVQSSVLRLAVQGNARNIIWPCSLLAKKYLCFPARLANDGGKGDEEKTTRSKIFMSISRNFIKTQKSAGAGLSACLLGSKPGWTMCRFLWGLDGARIILLLLALFLPILAMVAGYYAIGFVGIFLLVAARAAYELYNRAFGNFIGFQDSFPIKALHYTLCACAFIMLVIWSAPSDALFALYAALMAIGLNLLSRKAMGKPEGAQRLVVSHLPIATIALFPVMDGWILYSVMIWSLVILAYWLYVAFQIKESV